MNLYTFGYEGLNLDAFIARLKEVNVQQIVDVREYPLSRKKGFSKNALLAALVVNGIDYLHMAALGCPKGIRQRYKADGDWRAYEKNFRAYLKTQSKAVHSVAQLARRKTTCLICFEADYSRCHRSFVARAAVASGAPLLAHLTPERAIADAPFQAAA